MFRTSYPHAILHVDADAFFASVEQTINPQYKGKPLVTGAERGIITAASYEAKALGIRRGISFREAKKIYPALIIRPTDYETCCLFSQKMFATLRQFTPLVEENSIDEAFADLTGLRRLHRCNYPTMAAHIKETIEHNLGISVSVGLSLTKSLAKLCSKFRKPSGLTAVPAKYLEILLAKTKVIDICGIGFNTANVLHKYQIDDALAFSKIDPVFLQKIVNKTAVEIQQELQGHLINPVNGQAKTTYQSISKFRTFTPPSRDKALVKAFLLRNLEAACSKARRYQLAPQEIYLILRTQQFHHATMKIKLSRRSAHTLELSPLVAQAFETIFHPDQYRATGVVLAQLAANDSYQLCLTDTPVQIQRMTTISNLLDQINQRYGQNTLHLGTSLALRQRYYNSDNENLFCTQLAGLPIIR